MKAHTQHTSTTQGTNAMKHLYENRSARTKRTVLSASLAAALLSIGIGAAQAQQNWLNNTAANTQNAAFSALNSAPVVLTPLRQRLSDRQLRADINKLVDLHLRIDRLNTAGNPLAVFNQARAYTWLEAARVEYLDNNPTGWENVAFKNAQDIVAAMEQRQMPAMPARAAQNKYFAQAMNTYNANVQNLAGPGNAANLGRQSVLLDWAAYEEQNDPNFINTCVGHKFADIQKTYTVAALPPPPPPPPEAPRQPVPPLQVYDFPDSVHFALDEYYLSPESKAILEQVVAYMRQYPQLKINAVGHTDPRASQVYNQRLSERRATIVKNYIVSKGIAADRVRLDFKGEVQMMTQETDGRGHARNRRTLLSPQEGVMIQGANFRITNQERDLQIEKPGESREDNDKRRGVAPVKN